MDRSTTRGGYRSDPLSQVNCVLSNNCMIDNDCECLFENYFMNDNISKCMIDVLMNYDEININKIALLNNDIDNMNNNLIKYDIMGVRPSLNLKNK